MLRKTNTIKTILLILLFTLPKLSLGKAVIINSAKNKSHISHSNGKTHPLQYLYVQQSEDTTINKNGKYIQLSIHKTNSPMIYFSDAPMRRAGKINIDSFIKAWKYHGKKHLNLVIEGTNKSKGNELRMVVTIHDMFANKKDNVIMLTKPISNIDKISFPISIKNSNMFIDGLPCAPFC